MSYSPVELIRFLQIPSVAKYEHIMVIRNDSGALRMDDVMDTGPDIQSYLAENPFGTEQGYFSSALHRCGEAGLPPQTSGLPPG